MSKAIMGRFFKTLDAAIKFFESQPQWFQDRHNIVEFSNGYLVAAESAINAFNNAL